MSLFLQQSSWASVRINTLEMEMTKLFVQMIKKKFMHRLKSNQVCIYIEVDLHKTANRKKF